MRSTGNKKECGARRALTPFCSVMPRREATEHLSMASEISHFVRNDNTEEYAVMRDRSKSGNPLGNEDGIALVTALVLGLLGMLMVAAVLFMVNTGTWTSGSQKRYQTALAAAHGGNNFFVREIVQRGLGGLGETNLSTIGGFDDAVLKFDPKIVNADFKTKLTKTGQLGQALADGTNYPADTVDVIITFPSPSGLPGQPATTVNAAIVSTSVGNSGLAAGPQLLTNTGVVASTSGEAKTPLHIPYLYQIRVDAQSGNTNERARLNSLYAY